MGTRACTHTAESHAYEHARLQVHVSTSMHTCTSTSTRLHSRMRAARMDIRMNTPARVSTRSLRMQLAPFPCTTLPARAPPAPNFRTFLPPVHHPRAPSPPFLVTLARYPALGCSPNIQCCFSQRVRVAQNFHDVIMLALVATFGLLCTPAGALVASKRSENPSFMMISGVSSSTEMCLSVENGEIGLETCSSAIAAGDGRELWQNLPNGQIASVLGKKCMTLRGGESGDAVSLMNCDETAGDGGSQWEAQGNGGIHLCSQVSSLQNMTIAERPIEIGQGRAILLEPEGCHSQSHKCCEP